MLKSAKTPGRRIGSTFVEILNKVSFQKKNPKKQKQKTYTFKQIPPTTTQHRATSLAAVTGSL